MKYKVGNLEVAPEVLEPKPRIRRGGFGGGGNSNDNNGGKRNNGGGGGDRRDHNQDSEPKRFAATKYYVAMWTALTVVTMTFAGLAGAYIFLAFNRTAEWKPFDLPFQVFISTFLILASSITYEFARYSINHNNQKGFWMWLMATTGLGAAFISSQLFVWFELARQGIYLSSNPYAGFFYILTIAHALHLIGGIVILGYLVLRAAKPTSDKENLFKRKTAASVVGLYWHSMDGLWLVLLGLLAFFK
jgi:cytochrome c oxidase subunit 3